MVYEAKLSGIGKIFGSWRTERTFLKIDEKLMDIGPVTAYGGWFDFDL